MPGARLGDVGWLGPGVMSRAGFRRSACRAARDRAAGVAAPVSPTERKRTCAGDPSSRARVHSPRALWLVRGARPERSGRGLADAALASALRPHSGLAPPAARRRARDTLLRRRLRPVSPGGSLRARRGPGRAGVPLRAPREPGIRGRVARLRALRAARQPGRPDPRRPGPGPDRRVREICSRLGGLWRALAGASHACRSPCWTAATTRSPGSASGSLPHPPRLARSCQPTSGAASTEPGAGVHPHPRFAYPRAATTPLVVKGRGDPWTR